MEQQTVYELTEIDISCDRYVTASARIDTFRSRSRMYARKAKAVGYNSLCRACRTLFPLSSNDPEYILTIEQRQEINQRREATNVKRDIPEAERVYLAVPYKAQSPHHCKNLRWRILRQVDPLNCQVLIGHGAAHLAALPNHLSSASMLPDIPDY
jgi:hypothetical protein